MAATEGRAAEQKALPSPLAPAPPCSSAMQCSAVMFGGQAAAGGAAPAAAAKRATAGSCTKQSLRAGSNSGVKQMLPSGRRNAPRYLPR